MMKNLVRLFCILCALSLTACGGGGGGGAAADGAGASTSVSGVEAPDSPAVSQSIPAPAANALAVVIDQGPLLLRLTSRAVVNRLFASVTLCTAGSATACETIDHVLVDTGSVGLRIMASALSGAASMKAVADPASGSPLRECVHFADGYTWGSVVLADVRIAGRKLPSLPLNLIGDPLAGPAPASCVSGPAESTVIALGANGVLGIGSFLQDCGPACVSNAIPGTYYACPSGGTGVQCRPVTVALHLQVPNPLAALDSDNNGVTLQLPAVPQPGIGSANGTVLFGIGTQSNNGAGSARFFTLDDAGAFVTTYRGVAERGFIDSGSNAYFFTNDSLPTCVRNMSFYCPMDGGRATSAAQTATIRGLNGESATVDFAVDNVDELFIGQAVLTGLAGPISGLGGGATGFFDWGLPFFYGRAVHVLFEGQTFDGTKGPAVGF